MCQEEKCCMTRDAVEMHAMPRLVKRGRMHERGEGGEDPKTLMCQS